VSQADRLFKRTCREILFNGTDDYEEQVRPHWEDGVPAHTKKAFCVVNRYDLSKEFPILTLRKTNFEAALDEILWIWQKKSNNVHDLHSHIWDSWADETGSIGKAYGYQLGKKAIYDIHGEDISLDQVDHVLWQLKHEPSSRRILTNIYDFEDLHEMHLAPCAYSMTFDVSDGRLNGILNQRSNDVIVANNWNVVQYAALLLMFAQVSGLKPGILVHVIANAHIYDRHFEIAKELMNRVEYRAPRLVMNKDIKDFYNFTVDDFDLKGYRYGESVGKIPVAV